MAIHKLNLAMFDGFTRGLDCILFMRPLGSKLFRVTYLPERYRDNDETYRSIHYILGATCTRKHKNVWYFAYPETEIAALVLHPLWELDIDATLMVPEQLGRDRFGWPLEEILN